MHYIAIIMNRTKRKVQLLNQLSRSCYQLYVEYPHSYMGYYINVVNIHKPLANWDVHPSNQHRHPWPPSSEPCASVAVLMMDGSIVMAAWFTPKDVAP